MRPGSRSHPESRMCIAWQTAWQLPGSAHLQIWQPPLPSQHAGALHPAHEQRVPLSLAHLPNATTTLGQQTFIAELLLVHKFRLSFGTL